MKFGEKLQKLRRESQLSQERLAAQLNVSRQAVSKWELGTALPDTDNIVRLSKFFQVPIEYLMLEDCREPYDDGSSQSGSEQKTEPTVGKKQLADRKPLWFLLAGVGVELVCYLLCFVMQARDIKLFGSYYDQPSVYMVHMPLGWLTAVGIWCVVEAAWLWWKRQP